jgi:uncharacterized repeat protein (TIGR01451 family)
MIPGAPTYVSTHPWLPQWHSRPSSTSVAPGGSFTYVLTVTNDEDATAVAQNVVVTDALKLLGGSLSVFSVTTELPGTCAITEGAALSCQLGDLAPGQSATVTLVIGVAATDSCGGVDNIAFASATNHAEVPSNTVEVDIDGCVALPSITKLASAQTVSIDGGVLTYTITAANGAAATATAAGVTIEDELADRWDLDDPAFSATYAVDGGGAQNCAVAGRTVTCGPENLAPGSSMVATIVVVASPDGVDLVDGTKCHPVDNTAELFFGDDLEGDASADGVAVTGCGPDLSFEKLADTGSVAVGSDDLVTYTLTARNDEDATASANVTVFDTVPSVFEIVSVTSTPADACIVVAPEVSCTGTLAPGDELVVVITVQLDGGPDASQCGEWPNSAQLTWFEGEESQSLSDVVTVTVTGCEPGIALSKTAAARLDADGLVLDEVVLLDPDGPKQLLV